MLVVVITGPPGAGKSSVATAVHDALGDAGVRNALIEVDELERCYPALPEGRVMEHLRMLAASYRDVGHDLLFVTATLEDDAYASAVRDATAGDDLLLVRLTADPATLRARILAREPAGWAGLEELVAASQVLAATMTGLAGVDLVVGTEERPADETATDVEAAVRARLAARGR